MNSNELRILAVGLSQDLTNCRGAAARQRQVAEAAIEAINAHMNALRDGIAQLQREKEQP